MNATFAGIPHSSTAARPGTPPCLGCYPAVRASSPGATGHVYRGINVLLTGMAGYADPRWYTYRQPGVQS
ncbi:MAG: ArdC family protein [Myxococcota bacterium]|jgi:antirestriction protein ArdC|nr:ArdC family protein [Myxococcota bacterium]